MAIPKRLRYEILRRDNFECRYCGRTPPQVKLTVDHVVPEVLGGRTEPGNLVAACGDCNAGKSSVAPDAPLIGNVAWDALRWSRAMRMAADRMLEDRVRRVQVRDEFAAHWDRAAAGTCLNRALMTLPPGWKVSVDNLMAAGLPVEILKDCIDIAVQKSLAGRSLKAWDIFRYTCGMAWRKADELRESACAIASDGDPGNGSAHGT